MPPLHETARNGQMVIAALHAIGYKLFGLNKRILQHAQVQERNYD